MPALAQVGPQPLGVTPDVPSFPRAMLKLRVERPDLIVVDTSDSAPVFAVQPAGRFQIQTSSAAPDGGNRQRGDPVQ
jgi:hypothetical protein